MASNNPFKEGSTQYKDFELMQDLKWHCTKCELKSGQAKTWQVWRQEKGIQLDQDEQGHYFKRMECANCEQLTIHRKLKSRDIIEENLKSRTSMPTKLAQRIKVIYGNVDEYNIRTEPSAKLEIDHRVPQVRWTGNENENNVNMPIEEIKEKFMLLTRENNLLKSRICEACAKTNKRGKGYKEIEFWYQGNEHYDSVNKCKGCFWHNPSKWRSELNKHLKKG